MLKALNVFTDDEDADETALREKARQAIVHKRQSYTSDDDMLTYDRSLIPPTQHSFPRTAFTAVVADPVLSLRLLGVVAAIRSDSCVTSTQPEDSLGHGGRGLTTSEQLAKRVYRVAAAIVARCVCSRCALVYNVAVPCLNSWMCPLVRE